MHGPVPAKPDGTSYMPEYLALMDSCAAWLISFRAACSYIWMKISKYQFDCMEWSRNLWNIVWFVRELI